MIAETARRERRARGWGTESNRITHLILPTPIDSFSACIAAATASSGTDPSFGCAFHWSPLDGKQSRTLIWILAANLLVSSGRSAVARWWNRRIQIAAECAG
jgi:hypothetical protein